MQQPSQTESAVTQLAPILTPASQAPQISGAQTNTASSVAVSKNKKKGNQRSIVPKPSAAGETRKPVTANTTKKKPNKGAKVVEMAQPDSVSDSLQIQIPESTTEPDTSTHTTEASPSSTDILAKAAESIFSTSISELTTPVGGFYNPANEDNPLHIDTSAADGDEEGNKSPEKTPGKENKNVVSAKAPENTKKSAQMSDELKGSVNNNNLVSDADVTSLSATLEDIADMKFTEGQTEFEMDSNRNRDTNSGSVVFNADSKDDKSNKNVNLEINISKPNLKEKNSEAKDTAKQSGQSKKAVPKKGVDKNSEMMETFDDTLHVLHIPEAVSFSEDLNEVLDQVEHFGSANVESPSRVNKKSKSKRSKPADPENEPNVKKRKANQKEKHSMANEALLNMPTVLSVYDFDGTDDIVPQLLPLNAKEFTTLSSGKGSMTKSDDQILQDDNTNSDSKSVTNTKQNKTSAQTKVVKPSTNQSKPSKSAKTTKEIPVPCTQQSADQQLFYVPETLPADKTSSDTNNKVSPNEKQADIEPNVSEKEPLPSMPEIDTTTSLFGFPVVKRPQNVAQKSSPSKVPSRPVEQPSSESAPTTSKENIKLSPALPNLDVRVSPKTLPQISPGLGNLSSSQDVKAVSVSVNNNQKPIVSFSSALMSPTSLNGKDNIVSQTINSNISDNVNIKLAHKPSQSVITAVSTAAKTENLLDSVGSTVKDNNLQEKSENTKKQNISSAKVIDIQDNQNFPKVNCQESATKSVPELNASCKTDKDTRDISRETHISAVSNSFSSQNVNASNCVETSKAVTTNTSEINESINAKLNNSADYTDMTFGEMISSQNLGAKMSVESDTSLVNTNFSSSYSSESVFSSPNKPSGSVVKSPPNVTVSHNGKISHKSENASVVKGRNNIYSADNFVHSGRENGLRPKNAEMPGHGDSLMNGNEMGSASFPRLQNESSSDGFNFANIGLNIAPITTTAPSSSYMDLTLPANSSTVTSSATASSFSFSLSSSSGAVTTTTSSVLGQHQFPFYPPMLSSSASAQPEAESTQGHQSVANTNVFNSNNVMQRNNAMQRRDTTRIRSDNTSMQRGDTASIPRGGGDMPRTDNLQINRNSSANMQRVESMGQREDNSQGPGNDNMNAHRMDEANKPSCSKQAKLSKGQNSNLPELYPFPNPANPGSHDQNYYRNPHMKSNVGKSPTDQMHKTDKVMSEMVPPQSRSSNPNSQDKRSGPLDRSPQLMNQGQSYFPPQNYPPAKSLNTPPLHHPPMMEDRSRNMTNRSPYESSGPPSSQGFNNLPHSYPVNRFDGGGSSFSRDNSGTQPLSHTPINTGGRKSANPPQQKQTAPPLVSMPPQSRPAPPQPSHRPTPPLVTPPQAPTPSQVSNPSRPKPTASRSSKSKKTKQHPFVEVDSNLSNSIFEPNRSMTPFFPVQNLSPQSRAMQHDGSPFLPGNFFGPGPRLNSNTPLPKNSDIGSPFNPLFQPGRAQNGLGLNFQPGFGMNMNALHGNHGNGPQITPHTGVASHMPNFNLNNIFSDVNSSQSESLNISPIKFGHANSMLQHQSGMDPGAMQHHHQNYRGHPPPPPSVLSMNSILGPNHHGFDGRSLSQMNTSMAPPFHSHGHPPFIPPLNFSMHDH